MPRPGPRRPIVGLRLSQGGRAWVDQRAADEGLVKSNGEPNRSEMIRIAITYASIHMPVGWRPPAWKPSQ